MKYLPLLKLDIMHSYYADGRCPDFYIEANRQTQKTLLVHRCIFKNTPNGFMLLQAVSNDAAFIELPQSTILSFRMYPVNTTYHFFTDFSRYPEQGSTVFTNKGISGNELQIIEAEAVQGNHYFADVEIEINDTLKPVEKNPVSYLINCRAKQAYWEYFFMFSHNENDRDFRLVHAENQKDEPSEDTPPPIIFICPEPHRPHMITDWISKEYPDADLVYFVSQQPVLCQQTPRKNIQLWLNKKLLLDNLPNPSMSNINRRMNGEGDSLTAHDSFFHIVKHITRSF
ncbi:MAG: hypothetical protein D3922_09745 [Candidatus Electrothrix sp. AR1]|nr:hypothetical protein [Candidatus Electrothrix sp. AR1]